MVLKLSLYLLVSVCVNLQAAFGNDGFNNFIELKMQDLWEWVQEKGYSPLHLEDENDVAFTFPGLYEYQMNLT